MKTTNGRDFVLFFFFSPYNIRTCLQIQTIILDITHKVRWIMAQQKLAKIWVLQERNQSIHNPLKGYLNTTRQKLYAEPKRLKQQIYIVLTAQPSPKWKGCKSIDNLNSKNWENIAFVYTTPMRIMSRRDQKSHQSCRHWEVVLKRQSFFHFHLLLSSFLLLLLPLRLQWQQNWPSSQKFELWSGLSWEESLCFWRN